MAIDMSQFYQVFFEEAEEHLATMESLLLELDVDQPNFDDLNAIFRAAHSIKGGSGTFGFNDMTEVTHILETLLDRLRKSELQPTAEMVDAFLNAVDVLKGQLQAHRSGGEVDEAEVAEVCKMLAHLSRDAPPETAPPAAPAAAPPAPPAPQAIAGALHYQITLNNTPGTKLDLLLEDLQQTGSISEKTTSSEAVCFHLASPLGKAELLETFAFFTQPEDVQIHELPVETNIASISGEEAYGFFDGAVGVPELGAAESAEDDAYGFFVSEDQLPAQQDAALILPPSEPDHADTDTDSRHQPYGFFVEEDELEKQRENAQGYGFFQELPPPPPAGSPAATTQPPSTTRDKPARAEKPAAGGADQSSIRVSVEKVDQLINLVGELVITQAMLAQTASELDPVLQENLLNGIALLQRNTRDLQESVMSIRMMPMSFVFSRFPRMVRDLASKLNKDVQFKTVGEGTELDKGLIEKISDPLTHLVRNSLDHGIETPEVRLAKGKPAKGTLTLRAFHQGGNVVIEVKDDGGGLNRDKILVKAKERGLPISDNMPDQDVWLLIFAPGFSTADQVTDVSGRGVGMDVVKRNIESLGGRVEIDSVTGLGTTITIRLPLTLAILDGLSVSVGTETYIVPLTCIVESLQPTSDTLRSVGGRGRVCHVRGEYLPLIVLREIFDVPARSQSSSEGILIIVEADGMKAALSVDDLLGQHQVVIKSLESNYRKVPGISGATIMGDGRVAMILDVIALVRLGQSKTHPATQNFS
ncbi:MAG: chemotaxis protein CheA [Methylococcaceae bacterium]|nr:MAG: chemotaxis protein CheA [Methylococcaceae bacterium]